MIYSQDYTNSIVDTFDNIESIEVYTDGKLNTYSKTSNEYKQYLKALYEVFNDGRTEPAFGVSIHDLTVQEIKHGNWIKINFSSEQIKNELPFMSLLFKLEETYGVNLIREYNGKFDGRCIYYHFDELTNLNSLLDY